VIEHTIELRVRYAETDQMGIVYYSNYLVWFEIARTELFRSKGVEYSRIERERDIFLPVTEAYCRYRAPLKYDDIVRITVKVADTGNSRLTFEYDVEKDGKTASAGYTRHAFVNKNGKPVAIPADIKKLLTMG